MSIKERILLTIAVAFDPSDGNKFLTGLNKSLRHRDILLWMPPNYSRKNFYAMLGSLCRNGLLRRIKVNEKFAIQLTSMGLGELVNRYGSRGLVEMEWDGSWRLILGGLGGRLASCFGLGCLRRGVYISPFPFSDVLIQALGNERIVDKIKLFSESIEKFPDPRGLAKSAWRLDELNSRYAALIRRFQMGLGQQIKDKKSIALRKVRSDFITIAGDDPWLPKELLPADWVFFEVRRELNRYISII